MANAGVFPKSSTVSTIFQADYNAIQNVIRGVLSDYYGTAPVSGQISSQPYIFANPWDSLRADINRAYKHITGSNSAINDVNAGDLIRASDANAYKTAADFCETNKATVHPSQLTTSVSSTSKTVPWNGTLRFYNRYTWNTADEATGWFNLGGYFSIDVSGSNSTGSAKDNDWQNDILNAIPTQNYTRSNWVSGTDIDVYEYGNLGVYGENFCRIYCQKVSNTRVDIYVIVNDADTGDQTGIGPPEDEAVNTDVAASITVYSSFDAIVAAGLTQVPVENFDGFVGAFNLNITANQPDPIDLRALAVSAGWNQSELVVATIGNGVKVGSNTAATPAMSISGSFPNGVRLINNGSILGMGGKGGDTLQAGEAGGTALSVSTLATVQNNGVIAGGGGGGGAGLFWSWNGLNRSTPGSGGASSLTQALGGGGGPNAQGLPSTDSNADGTYDTPGPSNNWGWGGRASSPGGAGGAYGTAGQTGGGVDGAYDNSGSPGGAAGAAVVGNGNITWEAFGTRTGPIS